MTASSLPAQREFPLKNRSFNSRFRFRLYTGILALAIIGCSAIPQGNPNPPTGGFTRLYCFAAPGAKLRVVPSGTGPLNNVSLDMTAAPELNNVGRPANTPEDDVAFATGAYFFHPYTYTGDLLIFSPMSNQYEPLDDIEQWDGARTLVLIGKD